MSPSARDWRLYADDILEASGKIRRYVAGMSFGAFVADERTRDAVIRNVEVIGGKVITREVRPRTFANEAVTLVRSPGFLLLGPFAP